MKLRAISMGLLAAFTGACLPAAAATGNTPKRVIIFVWDGLRPDSVNAADTPNLHALKTSSGVFFSDNHSTYPTFTMMNAASFATGSYPGTTGFYGNTLYQPNPACNPPSDSSGILKKTCASATYGSGGVNNFVQPVFTEDYAILDDLQAYYGSTGGALFNVGSLFRAAQAAGLKTAAVGKTGPAAIQDYPQGGDLLDESIAYPQSLATELQPPALPCRRRRRSRRATSPTRRPRPAARRSC